jgi:hypothetical protein
MNMTRAFKAAAALFLALASESSPALELQDGAKAEALALEAQFFDAMHGQNDRVYLNGLWKFKPELCLFERKGSDWRIVEKSETAKQALVDDGEKNGYFKPDFNDGKWDVMPVPMPWNISFKPEKLRARTPFAGVAYYRTSFEVPAEKKGMRAILRFALVETHCKVWLNGKLLGEHSNASEECGPSWGFKASCCSTTSPSTSPTR